MKQNELKASEKTSQPYSSDIQFMTVSYYVR